MTDRELLELAAKAAGIKYVVIGDKLSIMSGDYIMHQWNPLEYDGDALRLAVKLRLQVTPGCYKTNEFGAFSSGRAETYELAGELQGPYAATRRAIVRAAAAIGEGMK